MAEFLIIGFVIVGSVTSYAIGYFRERKVIEPPEDDPQLPDQSEASLRVLFEAYSEEVRAKYLRNHGRRRSDKFLKEFMLASFHFFIFALLALACSKVEVFQPALSAVEITLGLIFLTLALKAGQLTAAKETLEHKERLLIHNTEFVNLARKNMMAHCPSEQWIPALRVRDEKSPLHY